MSVAHGVALYLAGGNKFDRDFIEEHISDKKGLGFITSKGGMKPEFFGEWLMNQGYTAGLNEYGYAVDDPMGFIDEVLKALEGYTTARKIQDVETRAKEIAEDEYYKLLHNGMSKNEFEEYEAYLDEIDKAKEYEEMMGWIDDLSNEELEAFDKLQEEEKQAYIEQLTKEYENDKQEPLTRVEGGDYKEDAEKAGAKAEGAAQPTANQKLISDAIDITKEIANPKTSGPEAKLLKGKMNEMLSKIGRAHV